MFRMLARAWIPISIVCVLLAAGTSIGALRIREIPDRAIGHSPPLNAVAAPREKAITYTVGGEADTIATICQLLPGGHVEEHQVRLPWTRTVRTRELTTSVGVTAQTAGSQVTCAIDVNGIERDNKTATGSAATIQCTVPVA